MRPFDTDATMDGRNVNFQEPTMPVLRSTESLSVHDGSAWLALARLSRMRQRWSKYRP